MTETPDPGNGNGTPLSAAARLFDLRSMIGGLFVLYGIMLTVAGLFTSSANLAKASNININLWMGLSMLALGVLFLVWWRFNPLRPAEPGEPAPTRTGAGR